MRKTSAPSIRYSDTKKVGEMKLVQFRIQDTSKGKVELAINIEAETQKEASMLIHVANRFPASIKCYGRVGEQTTWAWIFIPLKSVVYNKDYFGNHYD
jgi:hypothetical protein